MDRLRRWLEASAGERQDLSRSIRIYLLCSYLHLLLLSLHLRGLTISPVHTNRAAEEIPTLDYSTNPALYDGEPFRHCYQAHVGEGLASIQAWTDPRPGSRCLYAFHLFVGASGRVFRIQYAQRLRPWIAVRGEWVDYRALLIKDESRASTHILDRPLTSSSSRMKKGRQRLGCESHGTPKAFPTRRIKGCFTV